MERDGERKRSARHLGRLQDGPFDAMDDPSEDELLADEHAELDPRGLEVHAARSAEVGPQRFLDGARIDIDAEAMNTDAKRGPREIHSSGTGTERVEVPSGNLLGNKMREPQTTDRPLDGSGRIEDNEPGGPRHGAHVGPFSFQGGQRFRPR